MRSCSPAGLNLRDNTKKAPDGLQTIEGKESKSPSGGIRLNTILEGFSAEVETYLAGDGTQHELTRITTDDNGIECTWLEKEIGSSSEVHVDDISGEPFGVTVGTDLRLDAEEARAIAFDILDAADLADQLNCDLSRVLAWVEANPEWRTFSIASVLDFTADERRWMFGPANWRGDDHK